LSGNRSGYDRNGVSLPDDDGHEWLEDYSEAELPYVESHITHPGGVVHFAGAGPGDPDLITVRARALLDHADAIVHDSGLDEFLLPRRGKAVELHAVSVEDSAEDVGRELVRLAREGRTVVRLVAGDPLSFGQGAREAEVLAEAGVAFTVVPGVPEAFAAAARAGIPLTIDGLASSVTILDESVTGGAPTDWKTIVLSGGTLVLQGSASSLRSRLKDLGGASLPDEMPAAVITANQSRATLAGTVSSLPAMMADLGRTRVTVVVGWTIVMRDEIAWVESQPLFGRTLALCGADQAPGLVERLQSLGAHVLQSPSARLEPVESSAAESLPDRLHEFEWLMLDGPAAVDILGARLRERSLDARALAHLTVVALGVQTAAALLRAGIIADVVTAFSDADTLVEAVRERDDIVGARALLLGAQGGSADMVAQLEMLGVVVEELPLYRVALPAPDDGGELAEATRRGDVDLAVVASPEGARILTSLVGEEVLRTLPMVVADSATSAALGGAAERTVEPRSADVQGIVAAVTAEVANPVRRPEREAPNSE
jgi:uroporphyrinogen III methyltransferase/synthase